MDAGRQSGVRARCDEDPLREAMGKQKAEPASAGHDRASHGPSAEPAKSAGWASPRREGVTPSAVARTLARRVGDQRAQRILTPPDPGGGPPRALYPRL